jgi:hypothetical protein
MYLYHFFPSGTSKLALFWRGIYANLATHTAGKNTNPFFIVATMSDSNRENTENFTMCKKTMPKEVQTPFA